MEAMVQTYLDEDGAFSTELFERLRKEGRMDEFVEWIERLAEESPDDPALQVARGVAYLQKLFELGPTPEAGMLAAQADRAFGRALELDPQNWDARFTKAVALSNWPAFLGKTGEAIGHFEILIDQLEKQTLSPDHAQAYLFLGNMYVQTGEKEKAIESWRKGLAFFPDNADLQRQLELELQSR